MATITKGYTFSAGGTIIAAEHNSNFDTIYALVNGNIDNANIKAAAGIVDTKLAQITTASKVSGAALTSLTNIPSAAGVIPNINNIGSALEVIIDGGDAEIADSTQVWVIVPKAITITGAYAFADQSGSIVVDVWKDSIANFPPTDADTITASAPITISSATNSSDTTLTGWTKAVAALAVLKFNVDSCTTIQKCTIVLTYDRA